MVAASHDVGEGRAEGAGGFEVTAAAAGDEMDGAVFFDRLVVVDGPGAFVGVDGWVFEDQENSSTSAGV